MAASAYHVPGVYFEPQRRAAETPAVRTDVGGFIGFDPRVRDGSTPSMLVGSPASGHGFRVDVAAFQIPLETVRRLRVLPETVKVVPGVTDFVLSQGMSPATIPVADGQSIVYGLAVGESRGTFVLAAAGGTADVSGREQPPGDTLVDAAVVTALGLSPADAHPWIRIADVTIRRELDAIFVTARPAPLLAVAVCNDFRDYVLAFGEPGDDGTLLGAAVRAYFANGGRRCWVATLRRPDFVDRRELARVLQEMVGIPGSSELEATGLERLLLQQEVTFVDCPDLYAVRVDRTTRTIPLPPSEREACFRPCRDFLPKGTATSTDRTPALTPIFESNPPFDGTAAPNAVFLTQTQLLARAIVDRWRVLMLLSVPRLPDGGSGPYVPPTARDAAAWRRQFDLCVKQAVPNAPSLGDTEDISCAALYWPWVLCQQRVDDPVIELPPSAYAAAVVARRDLARGPEISAANETLRDVVGLTVPFGDEVHGALYDPDADANGFDVPAVNLLRAFPGYGVQVWGARTLSTEEHLRFMAVRRTLTAIELRMKAALDLLVFEPNQPALWMQITHTAFNVLLPLFESGALQGTRPEEAFYVRCDGRNNPPDALERGELLVEIGVAVAAPAEFIVFRVGRREGVIEVLE